jgi:hypothetical protein
LLIADGGGSDEPAQLPAVHASPPVHAFPSSHSVPSGAAGFEQKPVPGLQTPATWHWSLATQNTGLEPAHAPATHASVCVQALPSLHDVPSGAFGFEQTPVPGLQTPATWHWSLAEQTVAVPALQTPVWQVSPLVHEFPSLHVVPLGSSGFVQAPVPGLQTPAMWHWSLGTHTVGVPAEHAPDWQVSPFVHASPSLHDVPSLAFGFEHAPVPGSQTPATWHWSLAVQTTGFEPVHTPLWQESDCVQALPSLHDVPSLALGLEQTPVPGLQTPATWHWSLAAQTTGFEPVHTPLWHESLCVQALPSLQDVPSLAFGFEQTPVPGLHVPATWHGSLAVQTTWFEPVHTPLWHESLCVQAFPSLQVVPSLAFGFEHAPVPGSQVPAAWHWSLAEQTVAVPGVQTPDWQVSPVVHALPSLHVVPSSAFGFEHAPVPGSQTPATWHWSLAEQTVAVPGVHTPDWQVSPVVHALPSSQDVPSSALGFEHVPVPGLQTPATWHWSLAVQTTGFEPTQMPVWHESLCVHAFPSLQVVPSPAFGFEHIPVPGLQMPATWHWSLAAQITGFEPVQTPLWHESDCVQAFPSLQDCPSGAFGFEQRPVPGLHVPATWHWSLAVQTTGLEPVHTPLWHESLCVQALPSLHDVPSLAFGFEHAPVPGSQTPATWHWSLAEQTVAVPDVHTPDWQVSPVVHALPSEQVVPSPAFGFEQRPVPGLHVPAAWHWSLAVQTTGFEPVQTPLWHESLCVQAFPSLQDCPLGAFGFEQSPVPGLQVPATWHWSLAEQTVAVPDVQTPDWHVSPVVQAFPSLHDVPFPAVGFEQKPVAASHVPATWHWSLAVQTTGFEPTHTPLWHESICVHAFPSLHPLPFDFGGFEHTPVDGLHTPASWHWSLAEQTVAVPAVHTPDWQVSPVVQAFPSLHDVPSGCPAHASAVQEFGRRTFVTATSSR